MCTHREGNVLDALSQEVAQPLTAAWGMSYYQCQLFNLLEKEDFLKYIYIYIYVVSCYKLHDIAGDQSNKTANTKLRISHGALH